jgi:hypothetical protein
LKSIGSGKLNRYLKPLKHCRGHSFYSGIEVKFIEMAAKRVSKKKRTLIFLVVALALIVSIRLALPYVILHYANKSLAEMDGYRGHIEDIDLALIRGAYQIDSVYINKVDSVTNKETPFFAASIVDLSVEWRALFEGSLVGEVVFENPTLRFTKDKVEPEDVRKDSSTFESLQEDFMPLEINRMVVNNGNVQYIDEFAKPPVDITMTNTHILASNLRNSYDSTALLPASIVANANVYEGDLSFNMKINPLAETPTFDMNAELKNTNMVKLNDFFKAYAKADVSRGSFGLYTEIAAKDGKFKGYVKPMIKNLKVLGEEDREDNALKKLWEGLVGAIGEVFENQPNNRFATKVPFEGDVENPKANVWYAVVQVMQNAFVRALQPSLDQEINIADVDTAEKEKKGLEKLFSKDEDRQARREERKERKQKKKEERKKRRAERDDEKG